MSEREILFRGKIIELCKYQGQWLEGFFGSDNGKTFITIQNENGLNGYFCDSKTVGQYTGLKDKNGTRIFEGDIIKSRAAWYVVEFENGGYGLSPFGKGKLIPIMGHWNFNGNEVEVIGNIHDNPELLKGE